jgi:hypothetical protein
MAMRRMAHTGRRVALRKLEIIKPTVVNSIIRTGRTGGAMGGIPVNTHDIKGERITIKSTNRQLKNILPTIMGINIGKNAGPKPRK